MFSSKKAAFGLDLSEVSLKIAQFRQGGAGLALASLVKEDLPAGLVEGGEIINEKKLVSFLKKALAKAKGQSLSGKRVVCNLPEEKVFIRLIQLPKMKKEEIGKAVVWEAEGHIPLPIDKVYLDWQLVNPLVDHLDHIDVLISAAPKNLVDSYVSFLKAGGIIPVSLEPESVAVVRSLIKEKDEQSTIIVDLGATGTAFVVFAALSIRFTSRSSISGAMLCRAISQDLGVDEKEANELKIKFGLDKTKNEGKVYEAIIPVVDELAKQIADYVNFYQEHASHVHGPSKAVNQVLLCGGDSLLANLPAYLSKKLGLSVNWANPFVNINSDNKKEIKLSGGSVLSPSDSLSYVTAIGLALREIVN